MNKWEYLVVNILEPTDNNLGHYGALGWELITVVPNGQSVKMTCYFKRKIPPRNEEKG